jgi:hypothetical protein
VAKAEGEILFVLKYDVAKGSKIVRIMVNLVYIKSKSHSRRISEKYGNRVEFIRAGGVIRQKISRSLLLGKNRPGPNWPRIISITSVRGGGGGSLYFLRDNLESGNNRVVVSLSYTDKWTFIY